ncbi:hypothetical protein BARBAKC583_0613 [Bartonella bacilliformis KC583]|uniref:Uncharacterized protein n=1 Tax=Bartonella bacilliformis (strain ATCC 35685 / KC583 / Herrer 020/F12,63) TaxID=360095 RepID=A1USG6_BARBK|nr:hypothetical protein BARBAKC583_0613 [Bartonella bacilliformis KC583]
MRNALKIGIRIEYFELFCHSKFEKVLSFYHVIKLWIC